MAKRDRRRESAEDKKSAKQQRLEYVRRASKRRKAEDAAWAAKSGPVTIRKIGSDT